MKILILVKSILSKDKIDTSTTKKSGRITLAWLVMGDNLENPDRSGWSFAPGQLHGVLL